MGGRATAVGDCLLGGRLERIGECGGGVSDGRVGRHDLGEAVAGGVELLACCIETRQELVWTAPSRPGAQLIL